jgi:hypothetical protein
MVNIGLISISQNSKPGIAMIASLRTVFSYISHKHLNSSVAIKPLVDYDV